MKQLLWNRSSWIGFSRFYTWNCLCTPSGELNSNILACVHFSFHCANGELCRLKRKWNDNCTQFLGGVCNAMCQFIGISIRFSYLVSIGVNVFTGLTVTKHTAIINNFKHFETLTIYQFYAFLLQLVCRTTKKSLLQLTRINITCTPILQIIPLSVDIPWGFR